ncbi:PID-CTERM protein-sorting domain-containing protein [Pedobacter sp. V48]
MRVSLLLAAGAIYVIKRIRRQLKP